MTTSGTLQTATVGLSSCFEVTHRRQVRRRRQDQQQTTGPGTADKQGATGSSASIPNDSPLGPSRRQSEIWRTWRRSSVHSITDATEAVMAACDWLAKNKVRRIEAHTHPHHQASQAVAQQIAMVRTGDCHDKNKQILGGQVDVTSHRASARYRSAESRPGPLGARSTSALMPVMLPGEKLLPNASVLALDGHERLQSRALVLPGPARQRKRWLKRRPTSTDRQLRAARVALAPMKHERGQQRRDSDYRPDHRRRCRSIGSCACGVSRSSMDTFTTSPHTFVSLADDEVIEVAEGRGAHRTVARCAVPARSLFSDESGRVLRGREHHPTRRWIPDRSRGARPPRCGR